MASLHPRQSGFQPQLHSGLPQSLAGFIAGLSAASAVVWEEGGLTIEIEDGKPSNWSPSTPSSRELLLEFFACVCGNRSAERTFTAAPALDGFELSLRMAFPESQFHLEVDPDEASWSYTLHVLIGPTSLPVKSITLCWSVD